MTLADFDVEGRIGDGGFSEVLQVCAAGARPLHIVSQHAIASYPMSIHHVGCGVHGLLAMGSTSTN